MRPVYFATLISILCSYVTAYAGVYPEVKKDIDEFQGYFQIRFPTLASSLYTDGVNALPQAAEQRIQWKTLLKSPPYSQDMETARELWTKPFSNGRSLDRCFKSKPAATKYPYYDKERNDLITIQMDINNCLLDNNEAGISNHTELTTGRMALLVAAYKEKFNGQKIAPDVDSAQALIWYQKGRQFYWAKRGQLNYSCANCHIHNAGNKHRNQVLPAGLGQTSAYPVFSTTWAQNGNPWGTLQHRYAECLQRARAVPFAPQSTEYRVLQFYQAVMNTGIPLSVPGFR